MLFLFIGMSSEEESKEEEEEELPVAAAAAVNGKLFFCSEIYSYC